MGVYMKSFETCAQTKIATSLIAAVGMIGLASCGSSTQEETLNKTPTPEAKKAPNIGEREVTAVYFSDGSREIKIGDNDYVDTYSYCDGVDLVEQTEIYEPSHESAAGGSISRSVNHPACADGSLTPQDFELSTTQAPQK